MRTQTEQFKPDSVQPVSHPASQSPTLSSDIDFFTAELNGAPARSEPTKTPGLLGLIADLSEQQATVKKRLTKSLGAFNTTNNEQNMRSYARHLSDNQLATQLTVKTLNKTTQLIEKISNLS